MTNQVTSCDLVHNMCGWFIQFTNAGRVHRSGLGTVTEDQAVSAAHDLGFDEMSVWDFEQHTKDIRIPKGRNDYGSNGNGSNGHH